MPRTKKFQPFIAQCGSCGDLLVLARPRLYLSCGCGVTSVDAGDGYYMRVNTMEGYRYPEFYQSVKGQPCVFHITKKKSK